ncbi:hypothetical protein AgCh_028709 [Apium graveolens]
MQGKGIPLKDIPNVAYKLSKMRPDENLKLLHYVLYGNRVKRQRELIEEFSKEEHGEDDKTDEKRNAAGASG